MPLDFINQKKRSASSFHQPKRDPPLHFINQKGIPSAKKGICPQGQFQLIVQYINHKKTNKLISAVILNQIDVSILMRKLPTSSLRCDYNNLFMIYFLFSSSVVQNNFLNKDGHELFIAHMNKCFFYQDYILRRMLLLLD